MDMEYFLTDMSDLLQAGIDLDHALGLLARRTKIGVCAKRLQEDIRKGTSTSTSMRQLGIAPVIVNFIQAGEYTGDLELSLRKTATFLQHKRIRREQVQKLLAYPILLAFLTLVVFYILASVVMPSFLKMYAALGLHLSSASADIFAISSTIGVMIPQVMFVLILLSVVVYFAREAVLSRVMRLLLKTRWIGSFIQVMVARRAFEVMSFLLSGGIDLLSACRVMADTNTAGMGMQWQEACHNLERGKTLSEALSNLPQMPPIVFDMMVLAEKTGDMEQGVFRLINYLQRAAERSIDRIIRYIEPVSTTLLGVMIGGATLQLMLPMMELVRRLS